MPWRAAAARSSTTSSCVRPEICSTLTSTAPSIPRTTAATWSAVSLSSSSSGPKTLIARSLFTPEISSLTRRAIGCEQAPRTPGTSSSAPLIAPSSCARARPVVHSSRGWSMISTSVCSGPIGSSEISARPVLDTTVRISGNARSRCSTYVETATEPSSAALGRRTTLIAIAPSSSAGMNSVPTSRAAQATTARPARQAGRITQRSRSATPRTARYPARSPRSTNGSRPLRGRNSTSPRTGTTRRATASEARTARIIVTASGPYILPSIPCSMSSGTSTVPTMSTEKNTGEPTSRTARATVAARGSSSRRASRCRWVFSPTTIVASTTMPMANDSPPTLIRLSVSSRQPMSTKARAKVSGRAMTTTSAVRSEPSSTSRTSTTKRAPSARAPSTVSSTWSTSSVRS